MVSIRQVWFNNVPNTNLIEDKEGKNSVSRKDDKLIFRGSRNQFINDVDRYLDQISKVHIILNYLWILCSLCFNLTSEANAYRWIKKLHLAYILGLL